MQIDKTCPLSTWTTCSPGSSNGAACLPTVAQLGPEPCTQGTRPTRYVSLMSSSTQRNIRDARTGRADEETQFKLTFPGNGPSASRIRRGNKISAPSDQAEAKQEELRLSLPPPTVGRLGAGARLRHGHFVRPKSVPSDRGHRRN
uniref:Uncharacterized protein n=1 Tax=Trichuris muris TaxID=70415 RepID=A0A5S6Q894_TRIMR